MSNRYPTSRRDIRPGPPSRGGPGDPTRREPPARPPSLPPRTWLAFLVILVVNFLLMRWMFPSPGEPITVPYTFFREQIAAGKTHFVAAFAGLEVCQARIAGG